MKNSFLSYTRKKPLVVFFILTYIISWTLWAPLLGAEEDSPKFLMAFLILGGLGPLVSGIIVSRIIGDIKNFKERNLRWKVKYTQYLLVIFLPILMYAFAYLLFLGIGGEGTDPADVPPISPILAYPVLLLYVIILGGGLEEPGWRGFALPHLQKKYSPFISSIIIGLFWFIWHIPLFFSEITSQTGIPLFWYFLTTFALSCIFTMVYNRTNGNAFLAIILHGGINAPTAWYPMYAFAKTPIGDINSYIPITIIAYITVIILLVIWRPKFFNKLN